ncbi:YncE family protein [Streptomyces sp. NPDC001422]|uniref:YncE family protein n=1 Tax=Streptomyces sp. NPDC001422 TaxID=3364575 RepID=UPI0036A323C9
MAVEIYSTDTDSGQISVIRKEGSTYRTVKEIPIGNAPRGGVKFTQDGRGFVSNTSANTVSEIDALTHREVARITVGFGPRGLGIVPGEQFLLVSNSGSNTVSIVDLENRQELRQIAVGRDPRHMMVTADGTAAYVCVWGSSYIAKLDLTGLSEGKPELVRETARIQIGENLHPYSLNFDRSGTRALVACNTGSVVPVIDLASDTVIAKVATEIDGCRAVAFTPDNKYALASLERNNTVAVIDLDTYQVTRSIPVGPGPRGLAIHDPDEALYVSAFARNTPFAPDDDHPQMAHSVTVLNLKGIDLAGDDAVPFEELPVGFGPCSVAVFDTEKAGFQPGKLDAALADLPHAAARQK